jgi:hypothetical protein
MAHAIVSTVKYLLLVDLETKMVVPLEDSRPEYYGISWFPDSADLVLSHSGLENETLTDIAGYAQSEVGWVSHGQIASKKFLSAPHQLLCAPDGRIICTNTGRNVISVIDLNRPGLVHEVGVGSARWDRLSSDLIMGDHLNSVFLKDQRLFVIAHRFNKGSSLAVFSYPDLNLIQAEQLGRRTGLHNIWVTDEGQKISCHSETGSLVDLGDGSLLWSAGSSIYSRGLAACKEYVVVGESQKTVRDVRRSSMGGLWILDRKTWKALDYICLGPYGAVHEVRLLDIPDEAHHGSVFQGMQDLRKKDLRLDITSQRMSQYLSSWEESEIWRDYDLIFGIPEMLPDKFRRAGADNLCLVINNKSPRNEILISFDYVFNMGNLTSHVSAVLDYQGSGGDTDMTTFLLQKVDNKCSLQMWLHNGSEWSNIQGFGADMLPLSGTMTIQVRSAELEVFIDHKMVLTLNTNESYLKNVIKNTGIRWIGDSSVRPRG